MLFRNLFMERPSYTFLVKEQSWLAACTNTTFTAVLHVNPGYSAAAQCALDLDLDDNCQTPDGYCGNEVCMPTDTMQQTSGF